MGLIRAITAAANTVAADQWREFFTCDSLSNDYLVKFQPLPRRLSEIFSPRGVPWYAPVSK